MSDAEESLPLDADQDLLRLVWWRCQAILAAGGHGREIGQLVIATAMDMQPRPREVVVAELAKVATMLDALRTRPPTSKFVDAPEAELFALRVTLEGAPDPYYVMTMPRITLAEAKAPGVIELDLHPAPIDPVLTVKDASAGVAYIAMLMRSYHSWQVLVLDNDRAPRVARSVTGVEAVRVRRTFLWSEEPAA